MQGNDPYLRDPYHVEMIICQGHVVIAEKPSTGNPGQDAGRERRQVGVG